MNQKREYRSISRRHFGKVAALAGLSLLLPRGLALADEGDPPDDTSAQSSPPEEPGSETNPPASAQLRPGQIEKFVAGSVVRRGDMAQPFVYLTIDDGIVPAAVERALDIAAEKQVRLTFFPVGSILRQAPELWQRAVAEGHAIENHTFTHTYLNRLSSARIAWEIQEAHEALEEVLGEPYEQHFLRPPAGAGILTYDARILAVCGQLGYKVAMWSIDSNGYRYSPRTDAGTLARVLQNSVGPLGPGSILLQHAVAPDVAVLPDIIDTASERGLVPITMAEGME